jgi:hypothetical protein
MSTSIATAKKTVYQLEIPQHLIMRLCGGDEADRQSFLKNYPALTRIKIDVSDFDLLRYLKTYSDKNGKLPTLSGFREYVDGFPQSAGLSDIVETIQGNVDAGEKPILQDINKAAASSRPSRRPLLGNR